MNLADYAGCLEHLATKSTDATREDPEGLHDDDRCYFDVIDRFVLDTIKLLGSKLLRRLAGKTQVFFWRANPHVRTRLLHTQDVVQTSLAIAIATGLNKDLAMAGAYGHDVGHLPFGHHGETALSKILGFEVKHATVGVIVARRAEREHGLNLSKQTLEIILHHSSGACKVEAIHGLPEAGVVTWADKISYVFSDAMDFGRCVEDSDPALVREIKRRAGWFGADQRLQVACCIEALVAESAAADRISFSLSECAQQFAAFKSWLYQEAYFPTQGGRGGVIDDLARAYSLLGTCPEFEECDTALLLTLLTDSEARELIDLAKDNRRLSIGKIPHFGITEIRHRLRGVKVDLSDPWS